MPNLHSHAFQRAMAGLTEHASGRGDSFWTWRETMYGFLERLGPDEVDAIAAELYVEMLEAGRPRLKRRRSGHSWRAGAGATRAQGGCGMQSRSRPR